MWELLDISIPAIVLLPLVAFGVVLWVCLQQNARSSDLRRTEFQRLQRLAKVEHERAEREVEREFMRHEQGDSESCHRVRLRDPYGDDIRSRGALPRTEYGLMDLGLGEWRGDLEARRRIERGKEEQAGVGGIRRQPDDLANWKRREILTEGMRERQADEQEWQKRRADLEVQALREVEEERRKQAFELGEEQKKWKQEEALHMSPRTSEPISHYCVVCQKPTTVKRRCARCKSVNYWYFMSERPPLSAIEEGISCTDATLESAKYDTGWIGTNSSVVHVIRVLAQEALLMVVLGLLQT